MDINELKKTWDKLGAKKQLDEQQLQEMLGKRTTSLIERIDRNIKIGFVVLFALIVVFALDDFFFSPFLLKGVDINLTIPKWLLFLGVFSNTLIFTTFIYFVIKYYHVKKGCDISCNLKETLVKIIDTLKIYKRMFYLALITLMVAMGSGFVTGFFQGFGADLQQKGIQLSDLTIQQYILVAAIALVFLLIFVGSMFLFLRWGFRRLYGNYILKLKLTLKELEEIN